jgi:hypothetical protein
MSSSESIRRKEVWPISDGQLGANEEIQGVVYLKWAARSQLNGKGWEPMRREEENWQLGTSQSEDI